MLGFATTMRCVRFRPLAQPVFGVVRPLVDWHVEIHQFRILARDDGGKPPPEGMRRDGGDFVFMTFIDRSKVTGDEPTI